MSDAGGHAPNWYPDPMGRHGYRYYDGTGWTEHVSSHSRQSVDPLNAPDNYIVQFHRPLEDPLRALVVASAVSVDTAFEQDAQGLG